MSDEIKILYGITYSCPVCGTQWGDVSLQPDMWQPCPSAGDDQRHMMMTAPQSCSALLSDVQRSRFVARWIDGEPPTGSPMTERQMLEEQRELEHRAKYEALASEIGIDLLRSVIPISKSRVLEALLSGDTHLNSIQLSTWDAAAGVRQNKRHQYADAGFALWRSHKKLSLAERVSLLKHVAKFHYIDPRLWEGKTVK